jgi:hypothetical protein
VLSFAYRYVKKVPVLGATLSILNTYVYRGDAASDLQLAPFRLWLSAFYANFLVASALTLISDNCLSSYLGIANLRPASVNIGDLITSIFPNLVGFGIGVYALVFALSDVLVKNLHEQAASPDKHGRPKTGSVLAINAELAFPLLVLILVTFIGVFAKLYPNNPQLTIIAWWLFWFAALMLIEVVVSLFGLGEVSILNSLDSPPDPSASKQSDNKM